MTNFPILITSAGRRCQLIECFRNDARALSLQPYIIAADLAPELSAACQIADLAVSVPRCTDDSYIDVLLSLCRKHSIRLLVPTIDTELKVLATAKKRFLDEGVFIGISTLKAIELSQDKFATGEALALLGVPSPRACMWTDFDNADESWRYPLIFKPNGGSNSQGLKWAQSVLDVPDALDSSYLVQECLAGKEYTINCYFNEAGALLASVPHERMEIRGGEVSKAATRRISSLTTIAKKIQSGKIGWHGPMCFQAIFADEQYFVFEINARFGGGYPVAHRAGATFSKWLIQEALGIEPSYDDRWTDGVVMLRYDNAAFRVPT